MADEIVQLEQHPTPVVAVKQPNNTRYYYIGGGVFLLILMGMLAFIFLSGSQQPPSTPSVAVKPSITPTPTIVLTTKYANPFDEKESYENPFSESSSYTNPFAGGQ